MGYLECETEGSVKRHKRRFVEFVREAALYHDLGKNTIIPVVDNDYRPLTDQEFRIVKRHPEMGLKYLALDPKLAKYHDTPWVTTSGTTAREAIPRTLTTPVRLTAS